MYIRKQPSGSTAATAAESRRGRGNYEVSGDFESIPPIKPSALFDKPFYFKFGRYGYKPTGNVLRSRDGKKRVQLLAPTFVHGARQVEAALLFPKSRRDEYGLPNGQPTIMFERYIMRRMNFRRLEVRLDSVQIDFGDLEVCNASQSDSIDFEDRMRQVEKLHDEAIKFPSVIRNLLEEHRALLQSDLALSTQAEKIVRDLMSEAERAAPDYNIDYVPGTDVMEPLADIMGGPLISEPIPMALISPDDVDIRLREAAKWRRFAAARGPESAAFRRRVRDAYDSTCIVCGIRLPVNSHCRVPGVDSAHILPWATYDMELTSNGLCLCKMHHWAFDQRLIVITFENGQYSTTLTDRAREAFGSEAIATLETVTGPIPQSRLPKSPEHWPRPQFLAELYCQTDS